MMVRTLINVSTLVNSAWIFLGGSSIVSGLLIACIKQIREDRKQIGERQREETAALKIGMQAILRNELRKEYSKAKSKGYITFSDLDNFKNLYTQYETLGENGPMEQVYKEYCGFEKRMDDSESA